MSSLTQGAPFATRTSRLRRRDFLNNAVSMCKYYRGDPTCQFEKDPLACRQKVLKLSPWRKKPEIPRAEQMSASTPEFLHAPRRTLQPVYLQPRSFSHGRGGHVRLSGTTKFSHDNLECWAKPLRGPGSFPHAFCCDADAW